MSSKEAILKLTGGAAAAREIAQIAQEFADRIAPWQPAPDAVFVIDNPGNRQDLMCSYLYLCLDTSLPDHVIAKPIVTGGAAVLPVILLRARYRFTEGTQAMQALGLKDEVVREIKRRHGAQKEQLDS